MKKFVTAVMLLFLLFSIFPSLVAGAAAPPTPALYLNGKPLQSSAEPMLIGQTTFVPIRTISEGLGFSVGWKSPNVTIFNGETSMQLTISSKTALVDGQKAALSAPPVIKQSLTLVPLRFVGEQFGLSVYWDQQTKSVFLYQKAASPPAAGAGGSNTSPGAPNDSSSNGNSSVPGGGSDSGSGTNGGTSVPADGSGGGNADVPDANGDTVQLKGIQYDGLSSVYLPYAGDAPQVKTQVLTNPDRLVIDLPDTAFAADFSPSFTMTGTLMGQILIDSHPTLKGIRYSLYSDNPSTIRVVFDLSAPTQYNVVNDNGALRVDLLGATGPATPPVVPASDKPPGAYKIVIDPGHGGKDPGALAVNGRNEKEYNLALALKVKALLDKEPMLQGYLTRTDDTFVELDDRAKFANDLKADVFISLHGNSIDKSSVSGSETYYCRPDSVNLANIMQKHLVMGTGFPDRSVRQANFVVIKKTTMPAVLLESGYLTNPGDASVMFDDAKQEKIAEQIVAGIKEYLNLT
ncbi:N-acetylmuramoyl-L-alanine amidase family protein [Paenibacillus humicola]|uniref:N-acetylmuramoyl-L-alanine amidase family protein n=1 Tax=Paenibacillus humicola TaxID=3110540 RepID=UPI00237B5D10|nr:N-acetylmuramoyl-L-alanine amidase family protein [Paenibacillus humicola]